MDAMSTYKPATSVRASFSRSAIFLAKPVVVHRPIVGLCTVRPDHRSLSIPSLSGELPHQERTLCLTRAPHEVLQDIPRLDGSARSKESGYC